MSGAERANFEADLFEIGREALARPDPAGGVNPATDLLRASIKRADGMTAGELRAKRERELREEFRKDKGGD